jgi:hypothetical protein
LPKLTIYDIKRLTAETNPYFFDRQTMKFFRQTLRDFQVQRQPDGRYRIAAARPYGETVRYFNPQTNALDLS